MCKSLYTFEIKKKGYSFLSLIIEGEKTMNNKPKTEQEIAIESLKAAMAAYSSDSKAQEQEATALSNSLNVDREKILRVLKVAVSKD